MISLGSKVKDSMTGFSGIATGRTDWMYGCSRILIQPIKLSKDGKTIESEWFDEQRVELIAERKPKVSAQSKARTGGPQKDPQRSIDPKRG